MTNTEFSETKFSSQTELIYKGKKYKVISVEFDEGIITLTDNDILNVRYENCELAPSVPKYPEGIVSFKTIDGGYSTRETMDYQKWVQWNLDQDFDIYSCQSPAGDELKIGDKFKPLIGPPIIVEKFFIKENVLCINDSKTGAPNICQCLLSLVQSILPPSVPKTFRTFDDVEVEMDATVYGVHPKDYDTLSCPASDLAPIRIYHWFSTSEARSNWIAQNEKVYSRKEVIEAVQEVLERLGVK